MEETLVDYKYKECITFRKTKEAFGGLSNMAAGFPILVNQVKFLTSEALYQCCRFPHLPDVQQLIIKQHSPMTAKMRSKPYRVHSRRDWDEVRVKVMRWCLRVKLAQNWDTFGPLLLSTGNYDIVEESRKDAFWGAQPVDDDTLCGVNMLGILLMELRHRLREYGEILRVVDPPNIGDFFLVGQPINRISTCSEVKYINTERPTVLLDEVEFTTPISETATSGAKVASNQQLVLFDDLQPTEEKM